MIQADPDLPLSQIDNQAHLITLQMVGLNYITGMLGASGLLSMLLAAIGVYSLMSFTVAERTREFGIRMALGAQPGEVIGMIVRQGFRMVGLGLVIGLFAALAVSRVFASLIFGTPAFDPISMVLAGATLTLGAWVACYIPARWASKVDPVEALRRD